MVEITVITSYSIHYTKLYDWHVIPRWRDDRYFPEPVWGQQQRESVPVRAAVDDAVLMAAIASELAQEENSHEQ